MRKKRQATTGDNAASYISTMNSPTPYTEAAYWNEMDGQSRPMVELPSKSPNMVVHN